MSDDNNDDKKSDVPASNGLVTISTALAGRDDAERLHEHEKTGDVLKTYKKWKDVALDRFTTENRALHEKLNEKGRALEEAEKEIVRLHAELDDIQGAFEKRVAILDNTLKKFYAELKAENGKLRAEIEARKASAPNTMLDIKTRAMARARELIDAGDVKKATELVVMATSIDSTLDLVGIVSMARATEMMNAGSMQTLEEIISESIRFAEAKVKRTLEPGDRAILVKSMTATFNKKNDAPAPMTEGAASALLHPLDTFFPKIDGFYRPICLYNGIVADKCPNNEDSLCKTKLLDYPRELYHEWDGKNAWKCNCG